MENNIKFETPENVEVSYELAGMGSRFVAWVEDILLAVLITLLIILALVICGIGTDWLRNNLFKNSRGTPDPTEVTMYFMGFFIILMGFSNFLYFGLSELFMRGQTIGKKHAGVRVVKSNGYALDAGSIILRNLFRVIDNIAIFWLIPLVNKNHQRMGDMVAGTVVIVDKPEKLGGLRETLGGRTASEREFRFDIGALRKARPNDTVAVERILESRPELSDERFNELVAMVCDPLARRMNVAEPDTNRRIQFLEDYLAAEYQRQQRNLG